MNTKTPALITPRLVRRSAQIMALWGLLAIASAHAASHSPGPGFMRIEARQVNVGWPAEGVVEATRQATLAAQTTGRILEVRVDVGTPVQAGQVLMRIDAREAAQALSAAQAQLGQAQAQLARVKSLHAQKFVSQAALDQAATHERTAAAVAAQAATASGHGVIVAPFAGVIGQRLAEAGEMASPGRPLLTLFDPRSLRVSASLPQYHLSRLHTVLHGRIELAGKEIQATRIEVLPTADPRSHAVRVRLELPDTLPNALAERGLLAVPGQYARVHFISGTAQKLTVPVSSLVRRGELVGVYVADGTSPPRLRQVRLGSVQADGSQEILAGLVAGEQIAIDPLKAGFQAVAGR
jgi:RND family efflux transporter MFP subunit